MKLLTKTLLISLISVAGIIQGYGSKEGTTHIYGKNQGDSTYGVKIDIDSDLISKGDIIDFHIRGDKSGKLEVFKIGVSKNESWMFVTGWDLVNKVNREFTFGYNKNLPSVWDMFKGYILAEDINSIQYMIKKFPGLINSRVDGLYPIHIALLFKLYDIAKLLINSGCDVNAEMKDTRDTPLHEAIFCDQVELAELLIKKGASIYVMNNIGETPYDYCMSKDIKIIKLLIENGAPLNEKDKGGHTPIYYAVSFGFLGDRSELVQYLIDKGADLKVTDDQGNNLLHTASHRASENVVKLLISKGVDINSKNKEGKTSLNIAIDRGDQKIIALLRENGARE